MKFAPPSSDMRVWPRPPCPSPIYVLLNNRPEEEFWGIWMLVDILANHNKAITILRIFCGVTHYTVLKRA